MSDTEADTLRAEALPQIVAGYVTLGEHNATLVSVADRDAEIARLRERVSIQQDAIHGLGEVDREKTAALADRDATIARVEALCDKAERIHERMTGVPYVYVQTLRAALYPEATT